MQAALVLPHLAAPPVRAPEADPRDEVTLIGVARNFGRDQQIFGEGEGAEWVYKVVSGAVRAFRVLADGRRQIERFYLPGDLFGIEPGAVRGSAAEAISPTTVVVARRSALACDAGQAVAAWRLALRELQRSHDHILTLGRRSAGERLARFLVDLAAQLDSGTDLDLPMSRQDIADYLGLTIETVSRTMTQLQAQGLVSLSGCRHVRLLRSAALAELCE
jgi:CRP-like cAMP-binding protein